jgi:hypothetical protein
MWSKQSKLRNCGIKFYVLVTLKELQLAIQCLFTICSSPVSAFVMVLKKFECQNQKWETCLIMKEGHIIRTCSAGACDKTGHIIDVLTMTISKVMSACTNRRDISKEEQWEKINTDRFEKSLLQHRGV